MSDSYSDAAIIGALRLALVAAASAEAFRTVAESLLEMADPTDEGSTASTHALVEAVHAAGASFEVAA